MKKIIKVGKPKIPISTVKRFKCDTCECVFEADREDYNDIIIFNSVNYVSECPECGHVARKISIKGDM